jgi:hypothetical protein
MLFRGKKKPYNYGSLETTKKSGIIIGVAAYEKNEHDSKTLQAAFT